MSIGDEIPFKPSDGGTFWRTFRTLICALAIWLVKGVWEGMAALIANDALGDAFHQVLSWILQHI